MEEQEAGMNCNEEQKIFKNILESEKACREGNEKKRDIL